MEWDFTEKNRDYVILMLYLMVQYLDYLLNSLAPDEQPNHWAKLSSQFASTVVFLLQKGIISAGRISPNKTVPWTDGLNTSLAGEKISVVLKCFGWKEEMNSDLPLLDQMF